MDLLKLACDTAMEAGELLMKRPSHFDISTKSSAIDIATQMDSLAEEFIVSRILRERPDDGIVGEEGAAAPSRSGITWVIDPLDGTVNYLYGLPGWCVSIAAKNEADGSAIVGTVYAPTLAITWSAESGSGAFLNGQAITVSQNESLEESLLATGFSYSRKVRESQAKTMERLIPRCRDIRRLGAAAVDLCHVASGAIDGYFEVGLKEWDLAAGALIAREAGALVTGGENEESMVIAANPALHRVLVDFLQPSA